MQFPINQFEQYIEESILQKGYSYFKNGHVNQPEEISPGIFESLVEGSEDYIVRLELDKNILTGYTCTCPYDFGPICKHIAAVIFYLQQKNLNLKSEKKRISVSKSKSKTLSEQVNELLEIISHEDLKSFIGEQCLNNLSFRQSFLLSFSHMNKFESLEFYKKQVKSILNIAKGRKGFIDWSSVRSVGKAVGDLLNHAYRYFEIQNYKSAALICFAVIEEMTKALQFADDSNGDIGGCISISSELLNDIASVKNLPGEIRKLLFDYCIESYNKGIYSGWDWHLNMLNIAALLITTEKEADKIIKLLDKPGLSKYEEHHKQLIKLDIILKTKGKEAADEFADQHIANPDIRNTILETAFNRKEFERVIKIAKDGIKNDVKLPGLVMDWYDWLLKAAIATGDKTNTINYARKLFIESIHEKSSYYRIMKENIDHDKWTGFVKDLVRDMSKDKWGSFYEIAKIYISEQWWGRLLELLKNNRSLNDLARYEPYLSKFYPSELADLYIQRIIEEMKISSSRPKYKDLCMYIRRIKKLGESIKANNLIEKLKRENPRKKALLEELEKI